jgi:hypothetical protein
MKRLPWLGTLVFAALSSAPLWGQSDCGVVDTVNGPFRCPNGASCGTYYTPNFEQCDIDNEDECEFWDPLAFCCARYNLKLNPGDPCAFAKVKDPRARALLIELAEDNEILVPTCQGAYLPLEVVLRGHGNKARVDDGL